MKPVSRGAAITRLPRYAVLSLSFFLCLFGVQWLATAFTISGSSPNFLPRRSSAGLTLPPVTTHKSRVAASPDLTVHEWGTFTSIAGADGQAMEWLPLTGYTNLPSFVEHSRSADFKGGLRGTVRMETPVLYFYSPCETTVSVSVSFSQGLITEWYPHASHVARSDPRTDISLYQKRTEGRITWDSVLVTPDSSADFPHEAAENQYYSARETSASPLLVQSPSGEQRERFLFYRGVSAFSPSISAQLSADGGVLIQNHAADALPDVILFERRGEKLGYHVLGPLRDCASLAPPELNGSLDSLFSDLEGMLISQGLFADEAHAMLETWKASWFEEGSRLIYIVPRTFVDSVLPLSITPAPAQATRVFVGRLELITPATQRAVESAFSSGDRATQHKFARFLEPILTSMIQQSSDPARQRRLTNYLDSVYADLDAQSRD